MSLETVPRGHSRGAQLWTPTSPAAFHLDAARREQQRAYLARVFDVPLADVDPDRLRAEVRLRAAELDRWADDGGPVADGGPGFPPLIVTITADTSRFWAEMTRAMTGLGAAIREAADAMARMAHAVGPDWYVDAALAVYLAYERPVDRARRLRVDRAMRARARRAARHGRVLR